MDGVIDGFVYEFGGEVVDVGSDGGAPFLFVGIVLDGVVNGFVYEFGGDEGEVIHVGFGGGGEAEGPEGEDLDVGPVVLSVLDGAKGVVDA